MGGDFGPAEIVPAALSALEQHPQLSLVLVGDKQTIAAHLPTDGAAPASRLTIHPASEVVLMDEPVASALRGKRDSSMRRCLELVQTGRAQASVSAGNTGALMALSRSLLKMLPGIERPAICTVLPGVAGATRVLDLGANVDSSSEQLLQFAIMGSELVSTVDNKSRPSIGLLNVGTEQIKGNDRVKQAAALLRETPLNYVGFVEGNDLYSGKVDVIVCDGFTGNVALKSGEGVAQLLRHAAQEAFRANFYGRITALLATPVLTTIRKRMDPRNYNGASLLGLRGIVIKSHGNADRVSFANAIREAAAEIEKDVPQRISTQVERCLANMQ